MNMAEQKGSQVGYMEFGNPSYEIGLIPEVMTKIYQEQVNVSVLQRSLEEDVSDYSKNLIDNQPNFNLREVIKIENVVSSLRSSLPNLENKSAFIDDLLLLVEMYACLFDLDEVGLRLQVLDRAMCPRFHTDKLGCRLVSTYIGQGTEWLENNDVDRSKLGLGNMGLSDDDSGLLSTPFCIQQVNEGDVVLLKGEGWYNNEELGAVHRSPTLSSDENRLVVTLDFA
jgi:hypothetical protein